MLIKYGRCINPSCPLRGKIQDAEDSGFVCKDCQTQLTEAPAISGRPISKNKPLLVVGAAMLLGLALLGGVVYFWAGKPAFIPEPIPPSGGLSKEQALPKPDPKITGKKSLEEWLDDYSVDR